MEKRIVLQESNRYIYWIKGDNSVFYLSIPNASKVHLVLNLIPNVTDDVIKGLKHDNDKVLVIPIIDGDVLDRAKLNNAVDFQSLDVIFSNTINLAYQILSYNHLEVDNVVSFLKNLDFESFQTWFIQKYDGRVVLYEEKKEIDDVVPSSVQDTISNDAVPSSQVNNGVISNDDFHPDNDLDSSRDGNGSLGFVSYVLLGVVVAVMSLIFLYFLV